MKKFKFNLYDVIAIIGICILILILFGTFKVGYISLYNTNDNAHDKRHQNELIDFANAWIKTLSVENPKFSCVYKLKTPEPNITCTMFGTNLNTMQKFTCAYNSYHYNKEGIFCQLD